MDKLALMAPLKLPDEDSIQLLINGISSLAIKATAALLRINSLDEFLRDMQHITATCNDIRKSPTAFKKIKSKDQNHPDSLKIIKIKTEESYCRGKNYIEKDCSRENSNRLAQFSSKRTCFHLQSPYPSHQRVLRTR